MKSVSFQVNVALSGMRAQWRRNPKESKRLEEAGLDDNVLDAAISAFIVEVSRHAFIIESALFN